MNRRSIRPASGLAASVARFVRRFRREEGAAVAIWFAVLALPLAVLSFALIDVNRASVEKRHLQDALDAATLLAARSTAKNTAEVQPIGAAALTAQLSGMSAATVTSSVFTVDGSKIIGAATAKVTPVIANLWLGGDMTVHANSEVTRASTNLEVALVLDVTGSMYGSKMTDMKTAAKDLIDMVISDVQSPYYSKAALVPFSLGVNAGSYAASVRGPVIGTKAISGASWQVGATKNISGISKSNNRLTVTSNGHGFADGDYVYISGVNGMTQVNNRIFVVSNRNNNTFRLSGISSSGYSNYSSGGTIRECRVSDCSIVIDANANGYTNGELVYITGVQGMTQLNGQTYTVANQTTNAFSLAGTDGPNGGFSAYSSGGTAYCLVEGCEYYRFTDTGWNTRRWQISTCVTERTDPEAQRYTDAAAAANPVGRLYLADTGDCPGASIVPLSSDKTALKNAITNFQAEGSTAGQIGTAWGWYMVSPNFSPSGAPLWPSGSQPAAYTAPNTLKVVVIMTDGEFNTTYCNGVLARNSGYSGTRINCDAENGDGTVQAQTVCTAMKNAGVVVYTVGFALGGNATAETFVRDCATSSANVYLPSGGGALKDAFAAIGRDIMKLRLSK